MNGSRGTAFRTAPTRLNGTLPATLPATGRSSAATSTPPRCATTFWSDLWRRVSSVCTSSSGKVVPVYVWNSSGAKVIPIDSIHQISQPLLYKKTFVIHGNALSNAKHWIYLTQNVTASSRNRPMWNCFPVQPRLRPRKPTAVRIRLISSVIPDGAPEEMTVVLRYFFFLLFVLLKWPTVAVWFVPVSHIRLLIAYAPVDAAS